MTPAESWPCAAGWREFFDLLSDAVVVLDSNARVVLANTAALRLLPLEPGQPLEQLQDALGIDAVRWLQRVAAGHREVGAAPIARLAGGLDPWHCAVRLAPPPEPAPSALTRRHRLPPLGGMLEATRFLWESPLPTVLQGPDAQAQHPWRRIQRAGFSSSSSTTASCWPRWRTACRRPDKT